MERDIIKLKFLSVCVQLIVKVLLCQLYTQYSKNNPGISSPFIESRLFTNLLFSQKILHSFFAYFWRTHSPLNNGGGGSNYYVVPIYVHAYTNVHIHICDLTQIEQVPPAFQTSYSHKKCCSISSTFVLSHLPSVGEIKVCFFRKPTDTLLVT